METFTAELVKVEDKEAGYVVIPFDVEAKYGAKRVKVKATFDGHPYRGSIVRMGGPDYIIGLTKEVRDAIGKTFGQTIEVTVEKDEEDREVEISQLFLETIEAAGVKVFWDSLSYSVKRRFVQYVDGSKKEETRTAHLEEAIRKLEAHEKM